MKILVFSKQIELYKSNRQGFLLLELMVSTVVFILLMFVMHRYLAMTLLLASDACKRYETLTLLDSFIMQAQQDPNLLIKKKFEKDGITLTWTQQPFLFYQNLVGQALPIQCQKITINAVYKNNKGEQRISITTGICS
jgi:Tfp pilus assembly protein PilV